MENKNFYYLDEDIVIDFDITVSNNDYRTYYVLKYDTLSSSYATIYTGKVFVFKNQTTIKLYLNDILQSFIKDYKICFENTSDILFDNFSDIFTQYRIQLVDNGSLKNHVFTLVSGNRYPNKFFPYPLKDLNVVEQNSKLLMGNTLPHIPNIETDNFSFSVLCAFGSNNESSEFLSNSLYIVTDDIPNTDVPLPIYTAGITMLSLPLSTWLEANGNQLSLLNDKYLYNKSEIFNLWVEINPAYPISFFMQDLDRLNLSMTEKEVEKIYDEGGGVIYQKAFDYESEWEEKEKFMITIHDITDTLYVSQAIKYHRIYIDYTFMEKIIPVAIVDDCPARYYLKWVDRFGGIQCQGFDGKFNFQSNYQRNTITNQYEHKRNISCQVTNKWTLNSGYISEDDYIVYESIFVSPYLQLYDTEQDRTFDVLVENTNYNEKHYKNEKKMLNFNLTVVENKTQKLMN